MNLLLTPDQLELADSVRSYLAGTHGPDVLRRLDAGSNRDPAVWQGLVDMGLPGLCVPESAGGLGLGLLDAALIAARDGDTLGEGVAVRLPEADAPPDSVGVAVSLTLAVGDALAVSDGEP